MLGLIAVPASPLVWGRLLHSRRLREFASGSCPGLLGREVVQQVMAVCDQWVWFQSTAGPCQGLWGWFSL